MKKTKISDEEDKDKEPYFYFAMSSLRMTSLMMSA